MLNPKDHPPQRKHSFFVGLLIISVVFLFPAVLETPLPLCAEPLPPIDQDAIESTASLPETDQDQCILDTEESCRFYDIIVLAARRHEVETSLVMAIIHTESRYNPNAISPKGAQGLMQLMPRTAQSLGVVDSFNPEENVNAGVRHFKKMLKKFKGDHDLALAAYNAGVQNVLKHGGVPPFPETQHYIRKVRSWHDRYRRMEDMQLAVRAAVSFPGAAQEAVAYQ